MKELETVGKMTEAGRAAFAARAPEKPRLRGHEQHKEVRLDPALLKKFKNKSAWAFFEKQPPSYRKKAVLWVMNAKTETTRESRFARLLESAAAGQR